MTHRALSRIFLAAILSASQGCFEERALSAPQFTDATLFANTYYSPPGSNQQSVCFISATLNFSAWPPRTDTVVADLAFGRESRPVTAPPVVRDSVIPMVTVTYTRLPARSFRLVIGPPVSDTVLGAIAADGTPLQVSDWHCPSSLPFLGDTALLNGGYVPDSVTTSSLAIRHAGS